MLPSFYNSKSPVKGRKMLIQKDICTQFCSNTVYSSHDMEATQCPSTDEWVKVMCHYATLYSGKSLVIGILQAQSWVDYSGSQKCGH